MKLPTERATFETGPAALVTRLLAYVAIALCLAAWSQVLSPAVELPDSDLVVHEWGTFTSIAGRDGKAVEWVPFKGLSDLPSFVEHLRDADFKAGLRGTIRMETPVLYFHSSRPMRVSARAVFARGVITEWYPHASRVVPNLGLSGRALYRRETDGMISWDEATLQPDAEQDFVREAEDNRYYAARDTSATPLLVKGAAGDEREKFLFYRGVSAASLPVSATLTPRGTLVVRNLGQNEIPHIVLFERRGEKVGYQIAGPLRSEGIFEPPELNGTVDALGRDLEDLLTSRGLYRDEAHAMVETWQSSWFEEGSRLLYVVPSDALNSLLPLTIHPTPLETVRVFVGRIELVTGATEQEVQNALACHDEGTLQKYGRFINPILEEMIASDPTKAERLRKYQNLARTVR
jgi:hypothetical protein